MTTSYLRHIPLPSTQQVDDIAFAFKKVGSRGQCLLSSIFGKVRHDVFYIESQKVPPSTSGSTMIAVEGTIFAFVIPKKYDLSLLPTSGRVFD